MCAAASTRGRTARAPLRRSTAAWDAAPNAAIAPARSAGSWTKRSPSRPNTRRPARAAAARPPPSPRLSRLRAIPRNPAEPPALQTFDARGHGRAMKGDAKVIDYLNRGLRSELTAINQYWLHYRLLDNWGYKELAKKWREESIEEMGHADRFTDRILFLDGFPNMQVLDPLRIGQNVQEIIECDLAAEVEARALYLEAAKYCDSVNDRVSKDVFEDLAADEEGHIDFLETQLELIKQIGVQLYAQKHIGELGEGKTPGAE